MSGLFSIFNIANRGMSTQQKAINVTSHNIANANTEGYSRQRAIIETTRPFGMPSLNNAAGPGQLGTGAQVSAIQRVRDSFLDYQVRTETSTYGEFSARDKFLSEIEGIFNEPSDTGISTLVGKFFDSWQSLAGNSQSSNSRTIVVQQAAALADSLNHTANQLQKLKENTQSVIKDTVFEVNDVLNQIDQLNQQIIGVKVAGEMPNDLMDRRDQLLDILSSKFNITIDKKNFEGYEVKAEDLISGNKADNSSLIKSENNKDVRRLSYIDSIVKNTDGTYNITYYKLGDKTTSLNAQTLTGVSLTDAQYKEVDECRVIWADAEGKAVTAGGTEFSNMVLFKPSGGELKGYMSVQQDIDNYVDQLNKVAKVLAFSVNALHSGIEDTSVDTGKLDYTPFFVNSVEANKTYPSTATLEEKLRALMDAESDITAANISVNKQLIDNVMLIKTKLNDDKYNYATDNTEDGATDNARALAIAQLRDKLMQIQNVGVAGGINSREDMFNPLKSGNDIQKTGNSVTFVSDSKGMKIDNYFKDVIDRLGVQGAEAKRMVKNQESLLSSFQQTRESISGVSIDEEMANLIQYQHAYQANAKIISTVDELLDVVINGLKR
jgi:flagellar hook-associated protein 1 FlgK